MDGVGDPPRFLRSVPDGGSDRQVAVTGVGGPVSHAGNDYGGARVEENRPRIASAHNLFLTNREKEDAMTHRVSQTIVNDLRCLWARHARYGITAAGLAALLLLAVPGESVSQQSTHSGTRDVLTTLKHVAKGTIIKIEGGTYWVKLGSGAEVKLPISKNTNMVCPTRPDEQDELWQPKDEAAPVGFRIGDCPFQVGDVIKAETTDIGTVTFIRALDRQPPTTTQRLGLPQDYSGPILTPFGG